MLQISKFRIIWLFPVQYVLKWYKPLSRQPEFLFAPHKGFYLDDYFLFY